LLNVLIRHQRAGIAWGLTIYEELEDPLRTTSGRLDFAIFDRGKALSYFQRENPHRFEAVLRLKSLPDNERLISRQLQIHQELIAECWLVSETFVADYSNIHREKDNIRIRDMMRRYNGYLRAVLATVSFDNDDFVFVAHRTDEIESKLIQLEKLLRLYREGRGAAAATA